jgi:hypothetical protein
MVFATRVVRYQLRFTGMPAVQPGERASHHAQASEQLLVRQILELLPNCQVEILRQERCDNFEIGIGLFLPHFLNCHDAMLLKILG